MTKAPFLSFLFVLISIYSTSFNHAVVSVQCCHSDQQSLLLQLKDTLIFNATASKSLVKWNQSYDCCSWEGVTCEKGRATSLNLSYESIVGGIDDNSTLFNLQYLKSLDLSFNDITSTIPSRIGNLTNLTYLNFSNVFTGRIPKEILHLKKLRILDLSNWYYLPSFDFYHFEFWWALDCVKKVVNPNFRVLVENFSQLEELYLNGVDLSTPGNDWGQAISSSLPRLRVLSLIDCHISGPIDPSFVKLQSLSVINLGINSLLEVPRFFANYLNLTSLSIPYAQLYGMFPKEIFQVPTLETLDISHNHFDGSLPEYVFPSNSKLQSLVISHTNFTGPLPKSIAKLTQLVHLGLSYNRFVGPVPSFNRSKNLTEIDLSHNQFSGPIPSAHLEGLLNLVYIDLTYNNFNGNIPSPLFVLPSLERIDLSSNQFSGQVLEFLYAPSSKLEHIDLSSNKLHGPIPMSVFKLKELEYLSLSSNNFNGIIQVNESGHGSNISLLPSHLDLSNNLIYGEIPNWIWYGFAVNLSHNHFVSFQEPQSLDYLSSLDLSFNYLHGKIPNLPPNVYYLDLSSNCFTSVIPSDIGNNLTKSRFLSLANNGFTGVVPDSICNASFLEFLDLSNNSLKGIIPTCVLSLNINGVNLRKNNLSGPIPDVFPIDCYLTTLDLNGNLLTGRIPKSLANCIFLEDLDLGNNQMLDTFPMLLKNMSTLRVLILRSNKFYGQITCAESIGFWPIIQIVDVSSNNFTGEIPGKCLTKWHAMMAVKGCGRPQLDSTALPPSNEDHVSVNNLGPTVAMAGSPISHEDAVTITNKGLEMELLKITYNGFTSIDFSSNKFHGEIPKELGELVSLHALNLSNNVLSGQISSSFGNLCQLESLDLSRNHLSGQIPPSISNLNFLGFLNLSYNQLHGRIPTGTQIQTFSADRFQGNQGLCGSPLTPNCPGDLLPETPKANHLISGNNEIEWNLISVEIGFIVGFGTVIGPLLFWNRWRKLYFNRVEDIAFSILPQILLRKWLSWKMGIRRKVRVGAQRAN